MFAGVQSDYQVGPVRQNVFDQVGQDIARPNLDKDSPASGIQIFDLLSKQHRLQQLLGQLLFDLIGICGIWLRGGIGIDRQGWRSKSCGFDGFCKGLLGMPDQRCVESGSHRKTGDRIAFGIQRSLRRFDRGGRPGQDDLVVRVPVSQVYTRQVVKFALELGVRAGHGQHGAGVETRVGGRRHAGAARFHQVEKGRFVHHTGRPQGSQFPKTVPGDVIGLETSLGQQFVQTGAERPDSRLSIIGALQSSSLRFGALAGRRVNDLGYRLLSGLAKEHIDVVERLTQGWEVQQQIAPHIHVLRPLSGKQHHHFPFQRLPPVENSPGMGPGDFSRFGRQMFSRQSQQVTRLSRRIGHEGQAGVIGRDQVGAICHRAGKMLCSLGGLQLGVQIQQPHPQGFRRQSMQSQCASMAMQPVRSVVVGGILFQHYMEVGAAESKRTHSGAAGMRLAHPGACLGIQVKW